MADINLIKIDGKPLEKLIDVISKGIGTVYKPRSIRKEAEAKSYEIELIERAKSKACAESREIEAETIDRIQERLLYKELRRQENIEKISQIATQQFSPEDTVSEEKVDDDWTTRFFNIVEDISDDEMQQLWGRILAGEVKQPKSYSLRTLELLKNLSKHEAEAFTRASNLVISSNNSPFLFKSEDVNFLNKYNISFEDRLLLMESGLLQPDGNISRNLHQQSNDILIYFLSGRFVIKTIKKANTPDNSIDIFRFTKVGEELLKLINPNPSAGYIKEFCLNLEKFGLEVDYAFIINKNLDGTFTHSQPWLKFKEK